MGSNPTLGVLFLIFFNPVTLFAVIMILYKLRAVWLLNLPCVKKDHCMDICNSKHYNTYHSKRTSVVVCTDLRYQELHRQIGLGRVVKSGSLGG